MSVRARVTGVFSSPTRVRGTVRVYGNLYRGSALSRERDRVLRSRCPVVEHTWEAKLRKRGG